jgi:hypothetical protein
MKGEDIDGTGSIEFENKKCVQRFGRKSSSEEVTRETCVLEVICLTD